MDLTLRDGETAFTKPDGSVKAGLACHNCSSSYEACTKKLRGGRGCCCPVCYTDGTHSERKLVVSVDPKAGHPEVGDTVLYEAENGAVYGGFVESALDRSPGAGWRFRIVGHDDLFYHEMVEPEWKSRRILRQVGSPKPAGVATTPLASQEGMTGELSGALGNLWARPAPDQLRGEWERLLDEVRTLVAADGQNQLLVARHEAAAALHNALHPDEQIHMLPHEIKENWDALLDEARAAVKNVDELKQRIDTFRKPIDRDSLAKKLFLRHVAMIYPGASRGLRATLWTDLDDDGGRLMWEAMADRAIEVLQGPLTAER